MTGTAVAEQEKRTISTMLEAKRPEIEQLLPAHVDVNRFIKSALLAVARQPKLKSCTSASLFQAIVSAAELGLDFTQAKGHAYLVPYGNEATFMPGYRGLIDLAKRSGTITKIEAHPVHENDEFELRLGTESRLDHRPLLKGDRGPVQGAYAVAFFDNAPPQFEYMTLEQLESIRGRSKAKNNGPWKTDTDEMYRKTVVRRLAKYLPISPDLEKAIEADNRAIGLLDADIIEPQEDGERTAALAGKLENKENKDSGGEGLELSA